MVNAAFRLLALFGLLLPATAGAVAVTVPPLGPADYWVWAEGTNGAFTRMETHSTGPDALNLTNPTLGGITLDGHVIVETDRKTTGPATVVNIVLDHPGPEPLTTTFSVGAFVTFDLAVFSATLPTAQVRIQGSGVGGSAGGSITPDNSFSDASGFVTVYDTDANGQISTATQNFWEVRDNMMTTPIDAVFTLNTGTLYKVIVRSVASIQFNADTSFSQYAYMYMDPLVTSVTEGAEVFVSPNVAVPEPSAAELLGMSIVVLCGLARTCSPASTR